MGEHVQKKPIVSGGISGCYGVPLPYRLGRNPQHRCKGKPRRMCEGERRNAFVIHSFIYSLHEHWALTMYKTEYSGQGPNGQDLTTLYMFNFLPDLKKVLSLKGDAGGSLSFISNVNFNWFIVATQRGFLRLDYSVDSAGRNPVID